MAHCKIDKTQLLDHIGPQRPIFEHLFDDFKTGKAIRSPFREDKNPSFAWKEHRDGRITGTDFATGETFDLFRAVQELKGCGFPEALEIVAGIAGYEGNQAPPPRKPKPRPKPKLPEIPVWDPDRLGYFPPASFLAWGKANCPAIRAPLQDALEQAYRITSDSAPDHLIAGKDGWTVFFYIDATDTLRDIRRAKFHPQTAKTMKDAKGSKLFRYVRDKELQPVGELKRCLYGEQQLLDRPGPAGIVESEKDAILAGIVYPGWVWLATGGKSFPALIPETLRALAGREIVLFPDATKPGDPKNCFSLWKGYAARLQQLVPTATVSISDILERSATEADREAGFDIGDMIQRQLVKEAS